MGQPKKWKHIYNHNVSDGHGDKKPVGLVNVYIYIYDDDDDDDEKSV